MERVEDGTFSIEQVVRKHPTPWPSSTSCREVFAGRLLCRHHAYRTKPVSTGGPGAQQMRLESICYVFKHRIRHFGEWTSTLQWAKY